MMRLLLILIFTSGYVLCTAQIKTIGDIGNGYILVKEGDRYGIKKKNKYVIPIFFDSIARVSDPQNNYYEEYYLVYQNGNKGIFDKQGKMVIPVAFNTIYALNPNERLFEISSTDIRAFYITNSFYKIDNLEKVDHTLLCSRFETDIFEWLSVMQYFKDKDAGIDVTWEDLIPDSSKMNPKTIPYLRYFLAAEHAESLTAIIQTFDWQKKKLTMDVEFDRAIEKWDAYREHLYYPVTGITYKQAVLFCKLKSQMMNNELNPYYKKYGVAIRYRLPKINEWEEIAYTGLNTQDTIKNKMRDSTNAKGCQLFNYKFTFNCPSVEMAIKKRGEGLVLSTDYFPDWNGMYNIFGNVAEMLAEKGYCKGGSYAHYAKSAALNKTTHYEQAEPWLGMRCVAEIVFETKSYK